MSLADIALASLKILPIGLILDGAALDTSPTVVA